MELRTIGQAGLKGWRGKVADAASGPLVRRTSLDDEAAHALLGGVFVALSAFYLASTVARLVRRT